VGDRRGRRFPLCLLHHDSMLPRPDSSIFSLGVSHPTLARGGVNASAAGEPMNEPGAAPQPR
jgi:hypothetical protein